MTKEEVPLREIQNEMSSGEDDSPSVLENLKIADITPYPEPEQSLLTVSTAFLTGVAFGFGFEKSRVYEPYAIIDQFLLKRFLMFKMFFAAMGASFMVVAAGPPGVIARIRIWGQKNSVSLLRSCLPGGFLLGAGMAIAGACPGMVFVQIGANVSSGIYTFLGGLVGAVVFGIFHPAFESFLQGGKTIAGTWDMVFTFNYRFVCAGLAVCCFIVSGLFELYASWKNEGGYYSVGVFDAIAWPPQVGGAIVGLCQIPLMAALGRTLGASSVYMNITSCYFLAFPNLKPRFPYWSAYTTVYWWQSVFAAGVMCGAVISAALSNSFGRAAGVPLWRSLVGGFIMILGARLGGGCTSGHGITGITLLMNSSVIVVMGMFAGGISVAFLIHGIEQSS